MNFDIRNEGEIGQICFYGEIVNSESEKWGYDDSCPTEIRDFLKVNETKDLEIHINSCGGSCFGGIAIANLLKAHKGKKTCYIDGLCASIATVIASACDKVHITKNSFFMIHNAWLFAQGNKEDLRETIEVLEKMDNAILESYAKHLKKGIELDTIKDLMKAETWLCGEEILEYFNFELIEDKVVAYAKLDNSKFNYKNVPSILNLQEEQEEDEEEVCPECGKNPCECEVEEDEKVEEEIIVDKEEVEEEKELEKEPLEDKEEEIKDEVDEEPLEEEVEDKKVCEECGSDPCICEELKREETQEKLYAQAQRFNAFMKAQEFMKKYK